jgi:hypothetical protein
LAENLTADPLEPVLQSDELFAQLRDLLVFRAHHRRDIRAHRGRIEGLG